MHAQKTVASVAWNSRVAVPAWVWSVDEIAVASFERRRGQVAEEHDGRTMRRAALNKARARQKTT